MRNYGLPYTGSKSRIAEWLTEQLPECECFVDVFAGGCAVTHAMILSGKANRYIVNDIQPDVPALFVKALNGELAEDKRWISREDFFRLKDSDPLVRLCWSFGNRGDTYLYSKEIEPYKKAVHTAIVQDEWGDFDSLCPEVAPAVKRAVHGEKTTRDRRLAFQAVFAIECKRLTGDNWNDPLIQSNPLYKSLKTKSPKTVKMSNLHNSHIERSERITTINGFYSAEASERLQRIEGLKASQNLESLERCERCELPQIEVSGFDYRDLIIPTGATVFCDPPYADSDVKYNGIKFDNVAFIEWCIETAKTHDVYVTEYNIDNPHFMLIGEKKRQICLNGQGSKGMKAERLYKVIPNI